MKTEVSMWGDEVIIQTPGTNHAALAAVYAGMAIMVALVGFFGGGWAALFAGGLTLCLIPIPLVLFVKTSYRIVIYPKYWRLLKGEELMSEGSLLSLIGFARQASHTDSELLLVTRDHSFPLEVGVSEEEARFLTALVKR